MNEQSYSVERMAARMEIQDRLHQYCRGIDRQDWELARSVFHAGATDDHGPYKGDIDGLISWLQQVHAGGVALATHLVSNILIEFAGPDLALVESFCCAWQRMPTQHPGLQKLPGANAELSDIIAVNRYVDRFTKRDQTWKIEKRLTVFEAAISTPVSKDSPKPSGGCILGKHDLTDVLMIARAELGLRS